MEQFSVTFGGKTTFVRTQPISIDPDVEVAQRPDDPEREERLWRRRLRLPDQRILLGVDRADYTKGIPERFRAVDRLLVLHPEWHGKISLVQIAAPSRIHIPIYRHLSEELTALADEINWRHGDETWKPIIYISDNFPPERVYPLFRIAAVCVVSSLHDGMNLVSKEFVAARSDLRGVLLLSRFTGAAQELTDALLINPYAVDEFANAIHQALTMPEEEQESRMRFLRQQVSDNNIYRWAGMLLSEAGKLVDARDRETLAVAANVA